MLEPRIQAYILIHMKMKMKYSVNQISITCINWLSNINFVYKSVTKSYFCRKGKAHVTSTQHV